LQSLNRVQLVGIPDGPEGTRVTLEAMRQMTRDALTEPNQQARQLAISLTQGVANEDYRSEIERLFLFVRDQIRYVRDVHNIETIQSPAVTLEQKAGDCDDKAVLLAALLESIGHPARFAALAFAPDQFEHVIVETRYNFRGQKWLPLETTKPVPMGWYPEGVVSKMPRNIS
jgi:transglutaminase-like putative cysteine protease